MCRFVLLLLSLFSPLLVAGEMPCREGSSERHAHYQQERFLLDIDGVAAPVQDLLVTDNTASHGPFCDIEDSVMDILLPASIANVTLMQVSSVIQEQYASVHLALYTPPPEA